jgi:hypothetical protein
MRKKLFLFSLLLLPVAYFFIQAGESYAPSFSDRYGDTLPVDSSFYLPSAISKNTKFPKRKDVAVVHGYAHLYWTDLMEGFKSKKYFQLTKGLKVLQYEPNAAPRVTLTAGQIDTLYALLSEKKNFISNGESACFYPRHTFVFCNAGKQVIGQVQVCLQCDGVDSDPFPATKAAARKSLTKEGRLALEQFFRQAGLTTNFDLEANNKR